jgi:hypothetical protein
MLPVDHRGDMAGAFFCGRLQSDSPGFPIYPNFACAVTISKDGLLTDNYTLAGNCKLLQTGESIKIKFHTSS